MTEKLYDADSYLFSFDATVRSVQPDNGIYRVILDRTAFFPEEGGQYGDRGQLGGATVCDTRLEKGEIVHLTDRPLAVGESVHGEINVDERMRKMQNHSGEHIVSGLFDSLYGRTNVGFHLGHDDVTIDLDGELGRADLDRVEELANRAIYQNLEITAEYPTPDRLATMNYRSKLALTENVRIVTIPGIDVCACCAPHVHRTGEIGMIKLLDFIRYKGGIRIHMLCGMDALADYRRRYQSIAKISSTLAVRQDECADGVLRLLNEKNDLSRKLTAASLTLARLAADSFEPCGRYSLRFVDMDGAQMREFVNRIVERSDATVALFSGDDSTGYRFLIGSRSDNARTIVSELTRALGGKGGGSPTMAQGSLTATRAQIEDYFHQIES